MSQEYCEPCRKRFDTRGELVRHIYKLGHNVVCCACRKERKYGTYAGLLNHLESERCRGVPWREAFYTDIFTYQRPWKGSVFWEFDQKRCDKTDKFSVKCFHCLKCTRQFPRLHALYQHVQRNDACHYLLEVDRPLGNLKYRINYYCELASILWSIREYVDPSTNLLIQCDQELKACWIEEALPYPSYDFAVGENEDLYYRLAVRNPVLAQARAWQEQKREAQRPVTTPILPRARAISLNQAGIPVTSGGRGMTDIPQPASFGYPGAMPVTNAPYPSMLPSNNIIDATADFDLNTSDPSSLEEEQEFDDPDIYGALDIYDDVLLEPQCSCPDDQLVQFYQASKGRLPLNPPDQPSAHAWNCQIHSNYPIGGHPHSSQSSQSSDRPSAVSAFTSDNPDPELLATVRPDLVYPIPGEKSRVPKRKEYKAYERWVKHDMYKPRTEREMSWYKAEKRFPPNWFGYRQVNEKCDKPESSFVEKMQLAALSPTFAGAYDDSRMPDIASLSLQAPWSPRYCEDGNKAKLPDVAPLFSKPECQGFQTQQQPQLRSQQQAIPGQSADDIISPMALGVDQAVSNEQLDPASLSNTPELTRMDAGLRPSDTAAEREEKSTARTKRRRRLNTGRRPRLAFIGIGRASNLPRPASEETVPSEEGKPKGSPSGGISRSQLDGAPPDATDAPSPETTLESSSQEAHTARTHQSSQADSPPEEAASRPKPPKTPDGDLIAELPVQTHHGFLELPRGASVFPQFSRIGSEAVSAGEASEAVMPVKPIRGCPPTPSQVSGFTGFTCANGSVSSNYQDTVYEAEGEASRSSIGGMLHVDEGVQEDAAPNGAPNARRSRRHCKCAARSTCCTL